MFSLALTTFVLLSVYPRAEGAAPDWSHFNYDPNDAENGPANWKASCGSLARQSPINIVRNDVMYGQTFSIKYDNVDVVLDGVLANNGHSASFKLSSNNNPILTVTDVPGIGDQTFGLSSFHFHFGPTKDVGSEHTMGGQSYPAEIHFVHVNTKYSTLTEALANPDGLAVIGVFLEAALTSNSEFGKMFKQMKKLQTKESQVSLSVNFMELLPSLNEMYTYAGSLTTPPCSEVVQWFFAKETMSIQRKELAVMRMLKTGDKNSAKMSEFGNFRPVQPLQGRDVKANFDPNL